jgi:hypothetical protein
MPAIVMGVIGICLPGYEIAIVCPAVLRDIKKK